MEKDKCPIEVVNNPPSRICEEGLILIISFLQAFEIGAEHELIDTRSHDGVNQVKTVKYFHPPEGHVPSFLVHLEAKPIRLFEDFVVIFFNLKFEELGYEVVHICDQKHTTHAVQKASKREDGLNISRSDWDHKGCYDYLNDHECF